LATCHSPFSRAEQAEAHDVGHVVVEDVVGDRGAPAIIGSSTRRTRSSRSLAQSESMCVTPLQDDRLLRRLDVLRGDRHAAVGDVAPRGTGRQSALTSHGCPALSVEQVRHGIGLEALAVSAVCCAVSSPTSASVKAASPTFSTVTLKGDALPSQGTSAARRRTT
jgi:hypothetical protein